MDLSPDPRGHEEETAHAIMPWDLMVISFRQEAFFDFSTQSSTSISVPFMMNQIHFSKIAIFFAI